MSLLKNLASDATIANEKDSVGGGGAKESNLYAATVAMAYINVADSGAMGLALSLKIDGQDVRQTLWMSSGKAKGGNNFYLDKDGKKQYLPGFNMANSLSLLITGKEISEIDTEEKVIKLYNKEAKSEVPTKVQVVTEFLNKEIYVGLIKQVVDKTVKNDAGAYVPTGETREENEIDKFFRASDKMTTAEIRAGAETAEFAATWAEKWAGKTKDKTSKDGAKGVAGAPKAAGATTKPTASLFG